MQTCSTGICDELIIDRRDSNRPRIRPCIRVARTQKAGRIVLLPLGDGEPRDPDGGPTAIAAGPTEKVRWAAQRPR